MPSSSEAGWATAAQAQLAGAGTLRTAVTEALAVAHVRGGWRWWPNVLFPPA